MLSLVAAIAAAALAQSAPAIDAISQTVDGRQVIRLSFHEMASVTGAPLPASVLGHLTTPALRLDGSAFQFETGVRNIAINSGIASNSQAVTTLSVTVGLPQLGR